MKSLADELDSVFWNRSTDYRFMIGAGGSADIDGRLQAGDQLLSVDGYSLVGITQDRAAEILMRTSHTVRLEVAKQVKYFSLRVHC